MVKQTLFVTLAHQFIKHVFRTHNRSLDLTLSGTNLCLSVAAVIRALLEANAFLQSQHAFSEGLQFLDRPAGLDPWMNHGCDTYLRSRRTRQNERSSLPFSFFRTSLGSFTGFFMRHDDGQTVSVVQVRLTLILIFELTNLSCCTFFSMPKPSKLSSQFLGSWVSVSLLWSIRQTSKTVILHTDSHDRMPTHRFLWIFLFFHFFPFLSTLRLAFAVLFHVCFLHNHVVRFLINCTTPCKNFVISSCSGP